MAARKPGPRNESAETRELRRKATQRVKPWLRSTGPRTAGGKQRSAMNSLKTGLYTSEALRRRREVAGLICGLEKFHDPDVR